MSNVTVSFGSMKEEEKGLWLAQYGMLLETYRHHFDLILKGLALYLAIVGAIAGFIFTSTENHSREFGLGVFVLVLSLTAVVGDYICIRWARALKVKLVDLETRLQIVSDALPLDWTQAMFTVFGIALSIFAAASALLTTIALVQWK